MGEYMITGDGFRELDKKIEKLNKQATKYGYEPIVLNSLGYETEVRQLGNGLVRTYDMVHISVDFSLPLMNGFRLVAVLSYYNGSNVIKYMRGESVSDPKVEYYSESTGCEHCNYNRKRKLTYVLQEELTGDYIQVGKTCYKEFIGMDTAYVEMLANLDVEEIVRKSKENRDKEDSIGGTAVDLVQYLAVSIHYINTEGYKKAQNENSTARKTWETFIHEKKDVENVVEENTEEAERLVSWLMDISTEGQEYLANIKMIASAGFVTMQTRGYAASIVMAYKNYFKKINKPNNKGVHEKDVRNLEEDIGKEGDKKKLTLKVLRLAEATTRYGVVDIITMEDEDRNSYMWATSSEHKLEEGKVYTVSATIKKHGRYRGMDQTTLTRVKKLGA